MKCLICRKDKCCWTDMHPIKMPTSKAKVYVCWNCVEDLEQQQQKEDKSGGGK